MTFELISFPLCPYVQRSVVTLLQKGLEFRITYIDLSNKPDWFLAISPLGKVPVLRVDESTVLFESAAINEYIDETTEPRMMPQDPVERARARAWIGFSTTLLTDVYELTMAQDQEAFLSAKATLVGHLKQVEDHVEPRPYYIGEQFGLVDSTMAPVFMRIAWIHARKPIQELSQMPRLARWSKTLLDLPSVRKSVREDWNEHMTEYFRSRGSFVASPSL